jgi:hypothetical protein
MSKVKCECGHIFNLSKDSAQEYSLVPEKDIRELIIKADEKPVDANEIEDRLDKNRKFVLICPRCLRILVEENARGSYAAYVRSNLKKNAGTNVYSDL